MPPQLYGGLGDLGSVIELLHRLSGPARTISEDPTPPSHTQPAAFQTSSTRHKEPSLADLGDFNNLWDHLGVSTNGAPTEDPRESFKDIQASAAAVDLDYDQLGKAVKWRDEIDGADLEDNVEPEPFDTAASLRTKARAARRAKAKVKARQLAKYREETQGQLTDTATDGESAEELEKLRRSPDREAIIQNILQRSRPAGSPPTSPSPPKPELKLPSRNWPISNPFTWSHAETRTSSRPSIRPIDSLSAEARKKQLLAVLKKEFPAESKYLSNQGLLQPLFTPLNTSASGIHVFVDFSNIMIGFHDCLKLARDIPITTRTRRIPMCFHNFSLLMERGRPAAKRVLVGSDRPPAIEEAKELGFETNILERVHKSKELPITPRKSKSGGNSGLSSGSETTPGVGPQKWVEQAVDEILHLKILESLVDASEPSTIVLATGDAAQAEYSAGFLKMVERALEKGWMVELVSFKLNTSNAYKRREFRARWGQMFKWIQIDPYAEQLLMDDA